MQKYINKFNIKKQEFDSYLILIPGWATDWRIFNTLYLNYNFILPIQFWPFSFEKNLLNWLDKNKIKKVSLLGWSLGGFVASKFVSKYPDVVNEIFLISIRKSYKQSEISDIKKQLRKNKSACLYNFYHRCFYDNNRLRWFKKNLLKIYVKKFSLDFLIGTLNYLENARIHASMFENKNLKTLKIIHGEYDRIAPFEEAYHIKNSLSLSEFISVKDTGHVPFLKKEFNKLILPDNTNLCIIKK